MQHWQDMAWRIQDDTERVLLDRAKWLRERLARRICAWRVGWLLTAWPTAGSSERPDFDNIWIQPAAGDDGIAIGCAYYGYLEILKKPRTFVMDHAFLGVAYKDEDAHAAANRALIRVQTVNTASADICRDTAKLLAEGNVFGWFQGRSEFGPRALGGRSILADPRKAEMKDILNKRVKFRQAFRPFAPIVLAERANEIFEGDGESPYMLLAKRVRPEWRDRIPAIVHVDGTARVQTIRKNQNEPLYRLLKEFEALTGVPVLINTSFNVKGEPIVETPEDAMECFLHGHRLSRPERHADLEEGSPQVPVADPRRLFRRQIHRPERHERRAAPPSGASQRCSLRVSERAMATRWMLGAALSRTCPRLPPGRQRVLFACPLDSDAVPMPTMGKGLIPPTRRTSRKSRCARRWRSAISPTRSRPSCAARCRTCATG